MYITAEDRLKKLSDDLRHTEEKLLRATKDLKNIGDTAVQDKEDRKLQIRQKLARKMQTVSFHLLLDVRSISDEVILCHEFCMVMLNDE